MVPPCGRIHCGRVKPRQDAGARNSVRVVPADDPGHDVPLLGAQPGTFCCRGAAGEFRYRRAGHQDRGYRGEDAAFAQRPDDPPDMPGGKQLLRRFQQQDPAIQHVRGEREPAGDEGLLDHLHAAAQARPVTVRAGPFQLHGPAGSRSPKRIQGARVGPVPTDPRTRLAR